MAERQLTPAERMTLFQQNTRQHMKMLPSRPVVPNSTTSFELVKTRLTSRIMLLVSGTVRVAHASQTTIPLAPFSPATLLRSVRLSINNGFNPFQVSGRGLFMHNHLYIGGETMAEVATLGNVASVGGVDNHFRLLLELPISLNQRDAIGLINTSNPQTVVSVDIDFDDIARLFTTVAGYTITPTLTITPMVESFSIPSNPNAVPDLSVLKLVHEFNQTITSTGNFTFELQTGTTYRKIIAIFERADGVGFTEVETGNLELVFNQSDIPYTVHPTILRNLNAKAYSHPLPAGVYVFDFSNLGLPNYGGSRDYVDTERLSEFWLSGTLGQTGRLTVITETLARLG